MFKVRNFQTLGSLTLALSAMVLVGCSKPAEVAAPERAVRTLRVEVGSAGGRHDFSAEVRARTESRLGFRVPGKLISRRVNLGDAVKAGQVLAQLDPQDFKLAQDAAKAAQAAAQANYDLMQGDFKRARELRDQGFVSNAELDRRVAALRAAQSQLDQAFAQVNVQSNQAGYALLVADADGVVTGVDAEPGSVVSAGMPIVRLAQNGPRDVVFVVPEDQVNAFRAAASQAGALKVRLWGASGATEMDATLRELAAAADASTRTFLAKAELKSDAAKIGQTATVTLELPRVKDVIKLPLSAVFEHQGKSAVWVLDGKTMTVAPQFITVASADGNEVVVAGGLQGGQEVVTAGVHVLTPGQKVKRYGVTERAAAAAATAAKATSGAASR